MASICSRFITRSSPFIKSAVRFNGPKSPFPGSAAAPSTPSPLPSRSISPLGRFSSRCPSELGCAQSLLPLHSAVATARMTSCLSTTSRSCRALSQGTLCCTSPGL
ncbi:protein NONRESPONDING TO OXYLIPINS 2, mitochondrial-like isoform X1 [Hibiscus syriacus]|uniref:protein NONRESPONDING TO OXYLIPINS 2, mitochondrial-like isoform X1 n=2 Tax=Hibiscus syriacus TaxID=106335 RepID=UPI0019250001|nr:protein NONRESPONDING TO OXYLIPINS 2, mitochondrial-like isoform X1 [Hibiscus syriacus]XP_038993606.1 protein NONRESPONDING TO OXYLIPINS 2, mitochondrial-like isoform X1 [Hibiscus syriacus]XP_038993607.1 protein NONRESPONDING TO OXYLIPINS 2, mitochondrial-like isoform X1 [Hibiscus syriacus]